MKSKLITVAMGAVLLGTGTFAVAHDRDHDGWRRHEWREHEWRKQQWREHEWREHHRPHWRHEYYRYEPAPYPYYVPAPSYRYPSGYSYQPDGVSIILRGHIN